MRMRTMWLGCAVALAAAAVLVECSARSDFSSARPGAAVPDPAPSAPAAPEAATSPQAFALLELAVDTTPEPYAPLAFRVDVREPSGTTTTRLTEPALNGAALFGPVAPGAEVRVSVVAGGPRFGCTGDGEVIGEATTVVAASGGRQFLVVPTRAPHPVEWGPAVLVLDEDGWPLPGAKLKFSETGAEIEASQHGFCPIRDGAGAAEFEIAPPAGRPDLEPRPLRRGVAGSGGSESLRAGRRRDVVIDRLATDCRADPVERVCLRATDGRAWVRLWNVAGGGLASVPLGRYLTSWTAGAARREGLLDVGAGSVRFEVTAEAEPVASLVVAGLGDPQRDDPEDGLVLVERSERSCLLPATVLNAGAYEMMAGCGATNWFEFSRPGEDGLPCFADVPPGSYEIRTRRDPRVVSHCVVVPRTARGPTRVVAGLRPRAGSIHGRLLGPPQRKSWIVEARVFGEFTETRRVRVGDTYELTGLAPGIYSVWVTREDWGAQPMRGEPLPQSPWKNVVVDGVGSVTLDFEVK